MNTCQKCGNETINPKYCSKSCSVSANNSKTPKRIRTYKELTCQYCQTPYYRTRVKSDYCSNKCKSLHKFQTGNYSANSPTLIKKVLVSLFGNQCSICKIQDVWNNQPMVMVLDHIDGNSSNNNPDNLRLVCPNCDSQLPTFKSRNKGKGRYSRRMRYAAGQSS